jgi:hypothetical protein
MPDRSDDIYSMSNQSMTNQIMSNLTIVNSSACFFLLISLTQHPGFDFSGAEFNGQVPAAKDFMGGVKYS